MYKLLPIPSLFFLLLTSLYSLNGYAEDDQSLNEHPAFSIHIDEATQAATGIKTQELHESQLTPEIETFAIRVDLTPLISARSKYIHAWTEQKTAQSKLEQAKRDVLRSKNLLREQAISPRKLHDQQTQLKITQILFSSAQQQTESILLHSQLKWGKDLSARFLTKDLRSSGLIDTLSRPLYLIYQPIHSSTPSHTIFLHAFGDRALAQPATLVGHALPAQNQAQQAGTAFYYLSDQISDHLYHRVAAWLPGSGKKLTGVIIPASSLVWHLGLAYVYLQVDDELFKRIKITHKRLNSTASYFIQKELQQGDILVNTGAQLLLSEEFRGQIPDEDDD